MACVVVVEPHALTPDVVLALVDALVAIDRDFLRRNPGAPRLYDSGVRYRREPPRQERFAGVAKVLERRGGDCEDLACWRVAELQIRDNEAAKPLVRSRQTPAGPLYHILVTRSDGSVEDPSRRLGM